MDQDSKSSEGTSRGKTDQVASIGSLLSLMPMQLKDGSILSASLQLLLQIPGDEDDKWRIIGTLENREKGLIYVKHDDEAQIFRASNSWSIVAAIVDLVFGIEIRTSRYKYQITSHVAKKHGHYLQHKRAGYELKLYVPLKYWRRTEIG